VGQENAKLCSVFSVNRAEQLTFRILGRLGARFRCV